MKKEEKRTEKEIIEEVAKKVQKRDQERILRNFIIFFAIVGIGFATWIILSDNQSRFDYKGVEFEIVDEIAPYRTTLPVTYKDGITGAVINNYPYKFYLRNDPRTLEKVEFDGNLVFLRKFVINGKGDFNCDGMGVVGVTNLATLYRVLGAEVVKDENATCDSQERYLLLEIVEGEKTKIEQIGGSCYSMQINNCEILEATERFMIETFVAVNELI